MFFEKDNISNSVNRHKIESVLLFLFSASIFTSKPAIYISSALMVIFFLYGFICNKDYRLAVKNDILALAAIGLFFIGLISKVISPSSIGDVGHFIYKGLFLLSMPALIMALKNDQNRRYAIIISMLGFLVSVILSFFQAFIFSSDGWSGQRVGGLWDIGRWAEITAYVFAFILPTILGKNGKQVGVYLLLLLTVISLVLSGGRAGWIAAICSFSIFVLFFNRRILIFLIPSVVIFVFVANQFIPAQFNFIVNRISSVGVTTEKDYSNYSRLLMWSNGIKLIEDNAIHHPVQFLFGMGYDGFKDQYVKFINEKTSSNVEDLLDKTQGNYSLNDLHNAYIDSFNKMGLIYTLCFYSYFLVFMLLQYRNGFFMNGLFISISFFITGFFYTNYLEFQTAILFFLIAVIYSKQTRKFRESL